MVCDRCILVVRQEVENLGHAIIDIELGQVSLQKNLNDQETAILAQRLLTLGFELLTDKNLQLVQKVKTAIIDLLYRTTDSPSINLSAHLSDKLGQDYGFLSKQFSETEGITIEKHYINQKIERVKELLSYGELTLSEIAYQLHYSSVAHLSGQFKKITGLTPSEYKSARSKARKPIDRA